LDVYSELLFYCSYTQHYQQIFALEYFNRESPNQCKETESPMSALNAFLFEPI